MPTNYKIAGQSAPSANVTTSAYVVPSNRSSMLSSINIVNRSASSDTYDIAFVPNYVQNTAPTFVAITQGPTAAYSSDGITWTLVTVPNWSWRGVVYGNNTFVSTAYGSNVALTSTDGTSWISRTIGTGNWTDIAFANGIFCTVAANTNFSQISTDGISWIGRSLPAQIYRIVGGNNTLVGVSWGSSTSYTSTDGTTWVNRTIPLGNWSGITYGNGLFVAVSYNSTKAASSTDGITWTERTLPSPESWFDVVSGNGIFVATTNNSQFFATSTDAVTWTSRVLPVSGNWRTVSYGNNTFVTVGYGSNTALTSTNGVTWTQRAIPAGTSSNWRATAYAGLLSPLPAVQNKDYVYLGSSIPANSTISIKASHSLQANTGVLVKSTNGSSTFALFGAEIS